MWLRWLALGLIGILLLGFAIPEARVIPVQGASAKDWNPRSFWYYPWGRSGTHKGIDIFARKGTPVRASTQGMVLYSGWVSMGGNVVLVLSSKWRLHYYAHLDSIQAETGQWLAAGQDLGTVGDSGNAQGKAPHLHYSIRSLIPLPWRAEPQAPQGWRKMFYLDPGEFLLAK